MRNIGISMDHQPPAAILEPLPEGGAWLRLYDNVERHVDYTYVDAPDGEGGAQAMISWMADETTMKLTPQRADGLTAEAVLADLDGWKAQAEAWEPESPPEQPTVESLKAEVEALTAQNQMLTDCLLEMSEIVYA